MTEVTLLDVVTTAIFFLLILGLGGMMLEWLNRQDRRANRVSQCPPHEWNQVYRDGKVVGEYIFDGLRCSKCRQRPGGLKNGESWNFPTMTPP